ncbi:MAG TPA: amidohydrolase family protein [Gryllotalpicola sp.]
MSATPSQAESGDVAVDAYAHVGLPRFQSVEDYWALAGPVGVGRAVLCAFDSSPDLRTLHTAVRADPGRHRALGVPFGDDRPARAASVRAQLDAGFSGIRLADRDLTDARDELVATGELGGIAVVCAEATSLEAGAAVLLAHLERFPDAAVVGGHFASPRDPAVLDGGAVGELFRHPRFHVVFSRQGAFTAATLLEWAHAVVETTGWERILWGSESPVLLWRNETIADALHWIERLSPSDAERTAFLSGNAGRLFFGAEALTGPLELPADPWETAPRFPATLWARGLPVDQELAGRLIHSWLSAPDRPETFGDFVARILSGSIPPV